MSRHNIRNVVSRISDCTTSYHSGCLLITAFLSVSPPLQLSVMLLVSVGEGSKEFKKLCMHLELMKVSDVVEVCGSLPVSCSPFSSRPLLSNSVLLCFCSFSYLPNIAGCTENI